MLDKFIEELEEKKKNNQEVVVLDYVIERLKEVNVWFEVARNEVKAAIEDVYNDELYNGYQKELDKLSEEDINTIAWRVEDSDVWGDVYDMARNEIYNEIGVED